MNDKYWQEARLLILGCCSLGIFLTLGIKLLAKPSVYKFPENLTLDKWESISTDKIKYYGENLQGKRYQPESSANRITVEVYYIPNNSQGNKSLIQQYRELESYPENIAIIKDNNLGYYGLFTEDNHTSLTSCIHPQGKTAFTSQQFANLANQNLKSNLLPWILGVSDLRDWSCFWVNMSVSLENITEEKAYTILQKQLLTLVSDITQ
ncbi:MAG: cyanoexosortase A system-associated protein [Xenococcaceae cyanobacterium MO_207.B15]|nr:cyanoexosortase A system-associated protein [Xenococcaceae cyanobacterium MO_207.B15]